MELEVVRSSTAARKVIRLDKVNAADLVESYLFTDQVPQDAVVIDVRSEPEWETWHYPGATRQEAWELTDSLSRMDRDRKYVLYCDAGMQAAFLAEQMQRQGLEAYAFRGGTRALRECVETSPAP